MTRPTSPRKRLIIFIIFILLFIILIPVVVLYSTGYRLGKNLELTPTGGVYIYYPQSGVNVSIKGLPPQTTSIFSKSVLVQNLKPASYEIDVWKTGYSYWKKNIIVQEQRVAEAYPFLVLEPMATTTLATSTRIAVDKLFNATTTSTTTKTSLFVLQPDSEHIGTTTFIATSTVPNGNGILERDIYLYTDDAKDDKELMALWKGKTNATPFYFCGEETGLCDSTLVVTTSGSPIKHFDFYPGRNDIIIYSNIDGVFVTELDKREPQNFVTLAKGKVDFRINNGHIYIKDATSTTTRASLYELIYE